MYVCMMDITECTEVYTNFAAGIHYVTANIYGNSKSIAVLQG